MLKITLTGKPENFKVLPEDANKQQWATCTLVERAFINGAPLERRWKLFIPAHKIKWATKKLSNPKFTVLVDCDDLTATDDITHAFSVRVSEIHEV